MFPRKQLSGSQKIKKKKQAEKSIQSQRGSLDKFFVKKTNATSEVHIEELENVPEQQIYSEELVEHDNELNSELGKNENDKTGHVSEIENYCLETNELDLNIYDPRVWGNLD